jgi:hypothetical protein
MDFEYDFQKSKANQEKHGVDFEEAKQLWRGENVIIPATVLGEPRFMIIGTIKEHVYSCIFTIRDKKIRIISCRRSRPKEKELYHEEIP